MIKLNLPIYSHRIKSNEKGADIYDIIRKKYVHLSPEEWVRQNFIQYLINEKGCPKGLMSVERALKVNNMPRRADIIVHDKNGQSLIIVECKAPDVSITQTTMDQAVAYHMSVGGKIICLTNGLCHIYAMIDNENKRFFYLKELPEYQSLIEQIDVVENKV
ncbi:MAG: type I restriction enzyme HsdR N-terminal domain-containing protein [Flavobacteriales bacterium]|nr:type I restriction enzyme HsdR N-terminal domain-containing protein [Flavobacteriales bacterium]